MCEQTAATEQPAVSEQSAMPEVPPLVLRASSLRFARQFRLGGSKNWRARAHLAGQARFHIRASSPGSPSYEASVTISIEPSGKVALLCPLCHGQFAELQASRRAEKPIFSCRACANSGACETPPDVTASP